MNIKYILIIFLISICLISPLYASDNATDVLESPNQGNVINITNDNYNNYFEKYSGTILEEANISSGDTLRIGNVTNKVFVIDRQLEITTISDNDLIKNGYLKLVNGSSGSVIHGLKIINDRLNFKTEGILSSNLHGIGLFYTDNNTLYDNYVQLAYGFKVHALPMGSSSYNKIYNNTFISTLSTCVPMSECHNNIFYNNFLQTTQANIIYYNEWGHADYFGPAICINNTYIENTLNSINRDSDWIIAFAVADYDVFIINNTISNVYTGLDSLSSNSILINNRFINNTNAAIISRLPTNISNNTFENVNVAIAILNDDTSICNSAFSNTTIAIWSIGENTLIENNTFDIIDSYYAITLEGNNGRIINNSITVKNYGEAIRLLGKNTLINGNNIKTSVDSAIYVLSSNNTITNNRISSDLHGVYIDSESPIRYYSRDIMSTYYMKPYDQGKICDNNISNNVIDSDSFAVHLWGTVYNTTISDNNMTTKESTAILIDITNPFSNTILNNIINGQFINYTGVILNDDTFDIYFDENGTFKFSNSNQNVLLLITYLSDKEMIINSPMEIMSGIGTNLLSNVCFILVNGSDGTIIHDLTFRNTDKSMISINGACDIKVYNNDYYQSANSDELLCAINLNSTDNIKINNNDIYLRGKNQAIEGITINNSSSILLNNNNLILESDKLINALIWIDSDSLKITDNSIQLYGAGEFNTLEIENVNNLEFINNIILASSTSNISNLCLLNSSNIKFISNEFDITSKKTLNNINNSNNITFEFNKFKEISTDIIPDYLFDVSSSDNITIRYNLIYSNALDIINSTNTQIHHNQFVIYDNNINSFFNSKGEFKNNIVKENDTILFDNLKLNHYDLIFNDVVDISSYSKTSVIDATLIFNTEASESIIEGLTFNLVNHPAIILNIASNIDINNNYFNIINNNSQRLSVIKIADKSLNNSIEENKFSINGNGELVGVIIYNYYDDYYGLSPESNQIINNEFYISSNDTAIAVYNSMSDKTTIAGNEINVDAKYAYAIYNDYLPEYKVFMSTVITSNTVIRDNSIYGSGENVVLIYSKGLKTTVNANSLATSSVSSYAYVGNRTIGDLIQYNHIIINGSGIENSFVSHVKQSPIYYSNDSSNVLILENHIVSNYKPGDDYAIYIENKTTGVSIKDNYLISDNYNRYSDDAIYAPSAKLDNNALYVVYVSENGSDKTGNGSIDNPFKTVKYALDNVINTGKVYVLSGSYNESNITISKSVTLTGIGNVLINSNASSLFTITRSGVFEVNNITFINASAQSGSTFYNNAKLTLNNVSIINSTASGYGGAIYNNGDLLIVESTFDSNTGILGGVIANNKNAKIVNSKFINNGNMMNSSGGSIYNSDKGTLNINGCEFSNNSVHSIYLGDSSPKDEFGQYYGCGGAVYNRGNLYINDSSFDSNYAYRFGGAVLSTSKNSNIVEISNSIFTNNLAIWGQGGAVHIENGQMKVSNSTFIANADKENGGGALYAKTSSGFVYNSTFYKNTASYGGGAIAIWKSNIDIIACNISDNSADNGGALYIYSTRSGNHIVEKLNIYNSTITNNKGFDTGSVIYAANINLNIKNSNIYDNFAGNGETLTLQSSNEQPVNTIDVNHNWWGSENGPTDDIWLSAQYFREWDRHMNTWSILTPDEPDKPVQPSNGGQRPVNSDKSVNSGGSTTSNLIANGDEGTGSGAGYGTGFGSGFGNGFGNGYGTGSGNTNGISTGTGDGSRGSGSGYAGNYTNGEGTLGNLGSASTSGAGGSSSSSQSSDEGGKAYEITKDIVKAVEENSVYLSVLFITVVLILLIIGYKRKSDKGDEL